MLEQITDAVISLDEKYNVLANREIPSPKHTFGYEFPDPNRFVTFLNLNDGNIYYWNGELWLTTNSYHIDFTRKEVKNRILYTGLLPNHGGMQGIYLEDLQFLCENCINEKVDISCMNFAKLVYHRDIIEINSNPISLIHLLNKPLVLNHNTVLEVGIPNHKQKTLYSSVLTGRYRLTEQTYGDNIK